MQPQRDVRGLHRLPYHPHQFGFQRVEVRLVPQLGRVGFESLSRVVLPALEATIHESLHPTPHRDERDGYGEGGGDDRQPGLLTRERTEEVCRTTTRPR